MYNNMTAGQVPAETELVSMVGGPSVGDEPVCLPQPYIYFVYVVLRGEDAPLATSPGAPE
jgi:hypothetical protein